MTAQRLHIFNEAGKLCEFLRDFRLGDESPLSPPNLYESAPDQILDGLADRGPADRELFDQLLFIGQAASNGERPIGDLSGQRGFNLGVKRGRAVRGRSAFIDHDIMMS